MTTQSFVPRAKAIIREVDEHTARMQSWAQDPAVDAMLSRLPDHMRQDVEAEAQALLADDLAGCEREVRAWSPLVGGTPRKTRRLDSV